MNDGVSPWLALIIGVAGGAGGALITSLFALVANSRQLRHDATQTRIGHRIAARTTWLSPLRDALTKTLNGVDQSQAAWVECLVFEWLEDRAVKSSKPKGTVLDLPEAKTAKKQLDAAAMALQRASEELSRTLYQNVDPLLDQLIDELKAFLVDIANERLLANVKTIDHASVSQEEAKRRAEKESARIEKTVRLKVVRVNQRIEMLLEGIETTP